MKSKYLILGILAIMVGTIFIIGCAEKDVEYIPQAELEKICAEESWPPNCNVIAEPEGKLLCEKCKGLVVEEMEEIENIEPLDLTQITFFKEQEGKATDPDWSLDGSQIVFCLVKEILDDSEIYLVNADGTGLTKIGLGFDPSWSPVEDKIAYTFYDQIYTMNSNGKEITQLTIEYSSMAPSWSPDGTEITYTYQEGSGKPSIWIMNFDGTGKTPLTTSTDGECSISSFNYDGSKIVYLKGPRWYTHIEMRPSKLNEIWIMNGDGSNKHMIYASGDSYQWPFQKAWNKNNKIIFMKNGIKGEFPKMFVINSDGTNPKHMVSPTMDSLGRPNYFYLDPVWDNTYTKIVAIRTIIDGAQNVVTFSWKE